MLSKPYTAVILWMSLLLCGFSLSVKAQYGINLPIEKPKEFENRTLQSEKTDSKKFTVTRRFFQNLTSHYNYFFNANTKLNEVITKAKLAHKDDFSQLISFYNYSLDVTAADSIELDSVAFKAQTSIVLHDLRSDWADNMYLLWGACYYLKQQFDSAYMMFQFINYAFAEKEKDGYYRTIGSARDGNNAFEIATKEKTSLTKKIFNEPPSRNDAFVWQIRNYLAQEKFAEASTLIQTLRQDPGFPERLKNDLEEVQAYAFYKQEIWDSCAFHLTNALSNASNKQEQARWEFLLGQLYERTGKYEDAEIFYSKAIVHTTDPVMDVYARLSLVKVTRDSNEDYIEKNIAALLKMAKRDKYIDYRDIIYYMAARMELERKNPEAAIALLLKSTQYTANNPQQRNSAFLELAELTFTQRMYRQSNRFYDSLQMNSLALEKQQEIVDRKKILTSVVTNLDIADRQDSLQRIAQMTESDRKDFVKKLTRQLRKQQGLKDESVTSAGPAAGAAKEPAGLFTDDNKKGEWYFYNSSLRQKGLSDFKSKWGTRPNADNWRRSAALASLINAPNNNNNGNISMPSQLQTQRGNNTDEQKEITYEGLYANLPLTEEQVKISTDSLSTAMADLGIIYIQQLDDCISGTTLLEQVRSRFPDHPQMDKVLFSLYYCYNNNGEQAKANEIKTLMNAQFADNILTGIVTKGKNADTRKQEATTQYEKIYDLFIEGNFAEAIKQKQEADAKYGNNYWTPQLLYIESVYYIKQQQDSSAKKSLNDIITVFPGTPMAEKATTLLDVLNRRAEIEDELRNLVIEMPAEDTVNRQAVLVKNSIPASDSIKPAAPAVKDTVVTKPPVVNPPVAINTNPPKDTVATKPVVTAKKDSVIAVVPPKKDSITKPIVTPPVVSNNPPKDTAISKPVTKPASLYSFEADKPVYVAVLLNKVDPIFVNEARNAFYRYNRDIYFNKQMSAELTGIDDDNRLLLLSPFKNVQEATEYIDKTQPLTSSQIVPWLKGGKYYFLIISEKNLPVLQSTKNIEQYRQFLQQYIPGKF